MEGEILGVIFRRGNPQCEIETTSSDSFSGIDFTFYLSIFHLQGVCLTVASIWG